MRSICVFVLLMLALSSADAAIFIIDGKPVEIPTIVRDGKTFADPVALAKALGATITYDSTERQFVVSARAGAALQGAGQLEGD